MNKEIKINTEFIKLSSLLKLAGDVETGGESKNVIQLGLVSVNDKICKVNGKKIYENDVVKFGDCEYTVRTK
ncbi:MAG: RNA-binding S4 domain-containing protein [Clostridia bacterium]|nr:RNA-binding S4 domain-containing protein [Clostridia bacterium]